MKRALVSLLLVSTIISCSPQQKKDAAETVSTTSPSKLFDIGKLTLQEKDVPALMASYGIKSEHVTDDENTLCGYEVIKTSNPAVLKFGDADLSGINGSNKNHLMLHYNEKNKILTFYEVEIYTEKQGADLLGQLRKMGKPIFEKTGLSKGEIAIDENGDAIPSGKEEKHTFRVWENKQSGLNYYLGELGAGKDYQAELTVLNPQDKASKDWISFSSLDWYKNHLND